MLLFALLAFTSPVLKLNSDQVSTLYFEEWFANVCFSNDASYLMFHGDNRSGIQIYRISDIDSKKLVETTGRENINYFACPYYDRTQERLLFLGGGTQLLYSYNDTIGFKRIHELKNLVGFIQKDQRIYAVQTIENSPSCIEIEDQTIPPPISSIVNNIKDRFAHDSNTKITINQLLTVVKGTKLFVGTRLGEEIRVYDLETGAHLSSIKLKSRFSKYHPCPAIFDTTKVRNNLKRYKEYIVDFLSKGYRILRMDLFQDRLYGYLINSEDGMGIWVSLEGPDFEWDNQNNELKIVAMADSRILMGKRFESKEGDLKWELWLQSSLPKP